MLEPSICPNLLRTSLCQESYFKFTLDCTCSERAQDRASASEACCSPTPFQPDPEAAFRATGTFQQASRAHLAVIYDHGPKLFLGFRIVKGPSGLPYLNQESLPLVEVFPESVIDIFSLHIPQALVLEPNLQTRTQTTVWPFIL